MLYLKACLLLAVWVVSSKTTSASFESLGSGTEDCGDVQQNVEKGMIRLPDFSGEAVKDVNCSWMYAAPPDRMLMVKVDSVHLPPSDSRSSSFQLYVDNQLYDVPRNCVKCLKEVVAGKTIKVLFTSYAVSSGAHQVANGSVAEGVGSFQIRYKSFDPHRCSKPEQIENGHFVSKGRKVGQSVFYRCSPPYDLIGESEVHCIIPPDSPVPDWSSKPPTCGIRDCGGDPVIREAGTGSIASPGYPSYNYEFTAPCQWLITSQLNQQIKVSIPYLKLPTPSDPINPENSSRLSLIDGDSSRTVNLTESILNGSVNFTTLTNTLTVLFVVTEDSEKGVGFYMEYASVSSSCPKPMAPENGDVSGYSNDFGSIISFSCQKGFVLIGEQRSECSADGQWSHPTPSCEILSAKNGPFVSINDSSAVTAKFTDEPEAKAIPVKPVKNGKKKGKDFASAKSSLRGEDARDKPTEPNPVDALPPSENEQSKSSEAKSGKNYDKDHGPKSEPHLSQQVIPAKETAKKIKADDSVATMDRTDKKLNNFSKAEEELPDFDSDVSANSDSERFPFMSVTMIAIIAGVGAPSVVAIIILIAIIIYRRRYPVRMRFGRKFSTFENPMYVTKDAQHPRELKRLTTA